MISSSETESVRPPTTSRASVVTIGCRSTLPTMYVADETYATPTHSGSTNRSSSIGPTNLRFRKRSIDSSYVRKINETSPSSLASCTPASTSCGTPVSSSYSPDSGYQGGETPDKMYDHTPNGILASPIEDMKRHWRRRRAALYDTDAKATTYRLPAVRPHEMLPVLVVVVIIASAIFTVVTLTNALRLRHQNSKYQSIKFGHTKQMEKMEKLQPPSNIADDQGTLLGGKKAAIQFAYDMRNKRSVATTEGEEEAEKESKEEVKAAEETKEEVKGEEDIDQLTMKMAKDFVNMYDTIRKDQLSLAARKERLLEKLSQFGHFSTTILRPLDFEKPKEKKKEAPKKDDKKVKRNTAAAAVNANKQSPGDPFSQFVKAEDDFRFVGW